MTSESTEAVRHPVAQVAPEECRVLAIIVAYNSVIALSRCLSSLDGQARRVDAVLVIDNSDPHPLDLSGFDLEIMNRITVVPAGENLGPAGGFALGIAWFFEDGGFTHAWLMDDDTYPSQSALRELIDKSCSIRRGSAIFPVGVFEPTGATTSDPDWGGVLIDRLAVQLAGLPSAELFWWAEDTEYLQHRMPRKGVLVERAEGAKVPYSHVRRVGGRSSWKYYYEVRNTIWYRLRVQRGSKLHKLPRSLSRLFGAALRDEPRLTNVRFAVLGFHHGLTGQLGAQVRPPVRSTQNEAS